MRALVEAGRGAQAAKAINPLAYAPHGGKAAERALSVLEKIETNDLPGATLMIAEVEKEEKEEEEKEEEEKAKKKGRT